MNTKIVLVLCAVLFAGCSAINCVYDVVSAGDGKTYRYNLGKMTHATGDDDYFYRMDDGSYIYMNICGLSSQRCTTGSVVCRRDSDHTTYTSLGKLDTQQVDDAPDLEPGKGVSVTYSDGEDCTLGNWQTDITLVCDPTASGAGSIQSVDAGECWFRITFASQYACGSEVSGDTSDSESGSGSKGDVVALVILIVLLVAVVLYFVVGGIYQKKVKGATGKEIIIHNQFWCSLPSLVKDGVLFIFHGCKKGDYVSV